MSSHHHSYLLQQTDEYRYRKLVTGYHNFLENADKLDTRCVKVFSPLSNEVMSELELIREVSKELQEKKDEDMKKRAKTLDSEESDDEVAEDKETKTTDK